MMLRILLLIVIVLPLSAQKVTVADEINIRNDYSYDLLGKISENLILYRDKRNEHIITVYDQNLRKKREKELEFEKRRVNVHYVAAGDTTFKFVYSYREKDTTYYKVRDYDALAVMTDSLTLFKSTDKGLPKRYRNVTSEDKSKTALFSFEKNEIVNIVVIDNHKNEVVYGMELILKNFDLRDDFRRICLSNQGVLVFLFENDNSRFSRDDHTMTLIGAYDGELILESIISARGFLTADLEMEFNNRNNHIVIGGLSSEKDKDRAENYFYFNKQINAIAGVEELTSVPLGAKFIAEVYGKDKGKYKSLRDYRIQDLVLRADGGFLLVTEMEKVYTRRTQFNNVGRNNNNLNPGIRGWTDHYNEDIVIIALNPDGSEHWREVFFKKQFSQDDGGAFSSFFLFKTPSRLKMIYNDEIKNNNTVSEYILNPIGKHERNSLLSTEYQNLRLRFRDAIQISNHEILVPSEKSYKLRLVKVNYSPSL